PCHGNVPQILEAVKRGVMLSGAMPMVFPTISIAESFSHPTSMYVRNLMAMDTEEMIRAQPMDAVVVIGGCDKTLPAQIMAAISADLPTVLIPQCAGGAAGDWWVDQRPDPSHRDGPSHQAQDRSRRLRQARPRRACSGRPEAVGRSLHGAFSSRRRRAEADEATRRSH